MSLRLGFTVANVSTHRRHCDELYAVVGVEHQVRHAPYDAAGVAVSRRYARRRHAPHVQTPVPVVRFEGGD